MTSMQELDPYSIPLESINLVEASAGTGKSWTVTLLYLRLILEKNLTVDQILVVTFTDAATKELRDDIRNRLVEALQAFQDSDYQKDDEYSRLIKQTSDLEQAVLRLNRAKLSMDEAAIFTIHGFCQRTLSENAFEAGLPFESELMDDDRELMQNLTDDFWRRRFGDASATNGVPHSLIFKLQQKSVTPDSLLKDIRNAVGKPYLKLCGPENKELKADKWLELETIFKQAINTWKEQGDEITRLLSQPDLEKDAYMLAFKNAREILLKEINQITASGIMPSKIEKNRYNSNFDSKLFWLGTKEKTKSKFESIDHPFFKQWQEFLDCWFKLDKRSDDFLNNIRIELLQYLQQELPKEKARLGVLSFDDLLLQLQKALKNHPQLATDLRQKYKAALIDEFQDTDPIQYDIFSTIYKDSSDNAVFLVGDPKQAIYSFRGGDIHTYLKAKADTNAKNHYTLKTNWRSHPKLINAFNNLYGRSDNPFQDKGIEYIKVGAGKELADLITPTQRSPLQFWQYLQEPVVIDADGKKSKPIQVDAIRQQIASSVAGDIAELLNAANHQKALIEGKPITGGDIAILIRSHKQGDVIKAALDQRGIASVQSSRESIFETHEATEILRLLNAIADPQREDVVRRALVTDLMGYKAQDLLRFESDSNAWEEILLDMQNWHYQWKKQGFLPMMRSLMKLQNVHQHLLAYADGERRLTNVLHLSEIIHRAIRQRSLGLEEVLLWIKRQQENAGTKETELRLESDENLVKIVTIHKSKGLEYPIVYCPFIGMSGSFNKNNIFSFHEDKDSFLEIGSTNSAEHKVLKIAEEKAENTRLLYVALTRAKYQCTVVCFPEAISGSPDKSALGWLLSNGKTIPPSKAPKKEKEEQTANYYQAYNQTLQNLASQNIALTELPVFDKNLRYQSIESKQALSAREFKAEIRSQAQITSFSGLTAGAHAETPDYDSHAGNEPNQLIALENEFPRGATAGTALHEIYENLDFIKPVAEQMDVIDDALDKYGFDTKHKAAAIRLMEESLQAELPTGFSLDQITNDKRLNEMEFYLPLERLQIDRLKQILFQHLPKDADWQLIREAVDSLYFDDVEGFLKGFIDLIFEHEGKYYLADYKSNSLTDYETTSLFEAMSHSHYYLQYLLYSVALHRYLEQRIPDYSWDTHIGGVYYLFIRGMSPFDSAQGKSFSGVFYNKPSLELIEALDTLFMRLPTEVAVNG